MVWFIEIFISWDYLEINYHDQCEWLHGGLAASSWLADEISRGLTWRSVVLLHFMKTVLCVSYGTGASREGVIAAYGWNAYWRTWPHALGPTRIVGCEIRPAGSIAMPVSIKYLLIIHTACESHTVLGIQTVILTKTLWTFWWVQEFSTFEWNISFELSVLLAPWHVVELRWCRGRSRIFK